MGQCAEKCPPRNCIGGTLFIVFINDIAEIITAFLRIFADDTKVAKIMENEVDARELQEDINKLCEWARMWGMEFNAKNCK